MIDREAAGWGGGYGGVERKAAQTKQIDRRSINIICRGLTDFKSD